MQSIINKAMWAVYDEKGKILFGTIAHTKEESETLFKTFYLLSGPCNCQMIAIDIEPIK